MDHCKPPRSMEEFDKIYDGVVKKFKDGRDERHSKARKQRASGNSRKQ